MNPNKVVAGVLAIGVFLITSAQAQSGAISGRGRSNRTANDRATTIGVLGGLNLATLGGADADGFESKPGILLGGYASFGITKNFAIETGALYSQRGAKFSDQGVTLKFKLDYVEVPLLLSARFPGEGGVTPFFSGGPAFAFKASCGFSVTGSGTSVGTGCRAVEDELEIGIKSADAGLVGAAGVDVKSLRIALRYFLGLSTIDNVAPTYSIKNQVFSLVVGYGFRLR